MAIAALIHVIFGVLWIGSYVTIEMVLLRDVRNAKRLQDLATLKNHGARLSKMALMLGLLTLISGLALLLIKFGTDFAVIVALPESRTILIALWIVVALLVYAVAVLKPRSAALGKRTATLDPTQPLPQDFLDAAGTLVKLARVQGIGLLTVLVLMVLAVQGGI